MGKYFLDIYSTYLKLLREAAKNIISYTSWTDCSVQYSSNCKYHGNLENYRFIVQEDFSNFHHILTIKNGQDFLDLQYDQILYGKVRFSLVRLKIFGRMYLVLLADNR